MLDLYLDFIKFAIKKPELHTEAFPNIPKVLKKWQMSINLKIKIN